MNPLQKIMGGKYWIELAIYFETVLFHIVKDKMDQQDKKSAPIQMEVNKKRIKTSHRVQLNDVVEVYGIENLKPITQSKTNKYKPSKK